MATIDNYTISINVTGAQDLQVATNNIDAVGTKAASAQSSVDNFNNSVSETKSAVESANEGVEKLLKSFEGLATAIVGVGIAEFVKSAVDTAAEASKLAQGLGVSTQQFLEMSTAAGVAGISQDQLARGMEKLATNIDTAQSGTGKQAVLLEKLGLSAKELASLPLPEAFEKVTRAIAETSDTTLKAEASVQLLNRSFVGKIGEYVEEHEKLAGTMQNAARSADDAEAAVKSLKEGMIELSNNVLQLIDPLLKLIGDNGSGFLGAKITAEALLAALAAATWMTAVKVFTAIKEAVTGLIARFIEATGGAELLAARAANASAAVTKLTADQVELAAATRAADEELTREIEALQIIERYYKAGAASAEEFAAAQASVNAKGLEAATVADAQIAKEGEVLAAQNASKEATIAQTSLLGGLAAAGSKLISVIVDLGAAMLAAIGIIAAPAWAAIAVVIAAISAVLVAGQIIWRTWGNAIKETVGSVASWIGDKFSAIAKWYDTLIDKASEWLAIHTNSTSYLKDIVVTAKKVPVPGGETPPPVEQMDTTAQDKARLDLLGLESEQAAKRLDLELKLVSAGSTYRADQLALFDIEKQRLVEIQKYQGQIAVINADQKKTEELKKSEVAVIQQEEAIVNRTAAAHKEKLKAIQDAQSAQTTSLYMANEELKIEEKIKEAQAQAATLKDETSSNADKAAISIDKMRDAAIDALKAKEKAFGPADSPESARLKSEIDELVKRYGELKQATIDATNAKSIRVITDTVSKNELDTAKQIQDIKLQTAELSMTSDQKQLANLEKIYNEHVKILNQEMNQNFGSDWKNKAPPDAMEAYRNATEAARKETDQLIEAQQGLIDESKSFSVAWHTSWKQYLDDANNGAKQAQTMFSSVMNNMNTAIDNFVKTGKFSFKGFIQSVIQDFAAMELKTVFANLFSGLFSSISKTAPQMAAAAATTESAVALGTAAAGLNTGAIALIGSATALDTSVTGLLGASAALDASAAALAAAGTTAGAASSAPLLFFASGGEPPVGRPSVVGENGPELFIPKVPGTIIPNDQIMTGMANAPGAAQSVVNHNYTYNINAIDSRSVAQVFAENRKSLLGAMTMAQKEMPYSMAGA